MNRLDFGRDRPRFPALGAITSVLVVDDTGHDLEMEAGPDAMHPGGMAIRLSSPASPAGPRGGGRPSDRPMSWAAWHGLWRPRGAMRGRPR